MPDYYTILELTANCTQEEIRRKYRELAKRYHPDRNAGNTSAEARFKEIVEAYKVLGDSAKRREFDLANHKKSPFTNFTNWTGTAKTSRQHPQHNQNSPRQDDTSKAKTADPRATARAPFITRLRHTLKNHPVTRADGLVARGRDVVSALTEPLQRYLFSVAAVIGKTWNKRGSTGFSRGGGAGRRRSAQGFMQKNRPGRRCYQRGELDIVYTTPLTRAELKKGKKLSVRIVNDHAKDGYELLNITIPPASRDGQRLRIRGRGHTSELDGKRGDLYLHLEEKK